MDIKILSQRGAQEDEYVTVNEVHIPRSGDTTALPSSPSQLLSLPVSHT